MASTLPDIVALSMPFANNGDKNTLPAQQTDPGNGAASLATGFPPETGVPISDGGIPPARPDMNALGYLSTQPLWLLQQGGYYTFSQAVSDAIGGYPLGAILYYCNLTANPPEYKFLRSAKANNTDNFVTTPSFIGDSWIDVTPKTPGGMQIGSYFAFGGSTPPAGAYLLNGQTITNCQTLYPTFWTWVNSGNARVISSSEYTQELSATGVCGGFVIDSALGSVRLPDLRNGTLWGADSTTIGQSLAAGLPNITGSFDGAENYVDGSPSGAFYIIKSGIKGALGDGSDDYIGFDASLSNAIYGNSDTVQPPAIRVNWCIQVFNAAPELSEQESAQLASEMQTKAQTDLANVDSNIDYVVESWTDGTGGWYRKYRSGWVEQGGYLSGSASSATVTLPYAFQNTNYTLIANNYEESTNDTGGVDVGIIVSNKTTTTFRVSKNYELQWFACGQGATE